MGNYYGIASDVISYCESGVFDAAESYLSFPDNFLSKKFAKKIKNIRKTVNKVYQQEAVADLLYSDIDTICDMTGDRIFDEGRGNYAEMIAIAEEIKKIAPGNTMKKAMDLHIKKWNKLVKRED